MPLCWLWGRRRPSAKAWEQPLPGALQGAGPGPPGRQAAGRDGGLRRPRSCETETPAARAPGAGPRRSAPAALPCVSSQARDGTGPRSPPQGRGGRLAVTEEARRCASLSSAYAGQMQTGQAKAFPSVDGEAVRRGSSVSFCCSDLPHTRLEVRQQRESGRL